MEVTVSYNPEQLEAAVKFIAENNRAFLKKHKYIRKSIRDGMHEIAQRFPDLRSLATMGYMLVASTHEEGIDQDRNHVRIDIYVDPGLSKDFEHTEEELYFAPKEE